MEGEWSVQAIWKGSSDYMGSKSQLSRMHARSAFNILVLALSTIVLFAVGLGILIYRRKHVGALPPPPESDEERILELLRASGGQMFQKDIGAALGFSKSKTTAILNSLEARKIVRKEKRGREYLVRLR
jgi:uncharacterized membrane protein